MKYNLLSVLKNNSEVLVLHLSILVLFYFVLHSYYTTFRSKFCNLSFLHVSSYLNQCWEPTAATVCWIQGARATFYDHLPNGWGYVQAFRPLKGLPVFFVEPGGYVSFASISSIYWDNSLWIIPRSLCLGCFGIIHFPVKFTASVY